MTGTGTVGVGRGGEEGTMTGVGMLSVVSGVEDDGAATEAAVGTEADADDGEATGVDGAASGDESPGDDVGMDGGVDTDASASDEGVEDATVASSLLVGSLDSMGGG